MSLESSKKEDVMSKDTVNDRMPNFVVKCLINFCTYFLGTVRIDGP